MENKLIKVYSHPRSGTNFIESLLKDNFYPNDDLSVIGGWGHWSAPQKFKDPVLFGKLFGSHLPPQRKKPGPAIYIYRDGRAVALSIWKSKFFLNAEMEKMPFSTYLRTPLDWRNSPSMRIKQGQGLPIIQHWHSHVERWHSELENNPDVLFIRYEDLHTNTYNILEFISNKFKLNWINKTIVSYPVGPSPNSGQLDAWKQYFDKDSLEYFYNIVSESSKYLYKERHNELCS